MTPVRLEPALTFTGSLGSCLNTRSIYCPKGPGKCKCNATDMCDRYSCIFYMFLNPAQFILITLQKHLNIHFHILDFTEQKNGVCCKVSNGIQSSHRHRRFCSPRFRRQNYRRDSFEAFSSLNPCSNSTWIFWFEHVFLFIKSRMYI